MSAQSTEPRLELTTSRHFTAWMAEQRLSLAFTTYQAGKIFALGLKPDRSLSIFERTFNRAMGLAAYDDRLYLATLFQLWRFDDALRGARAGGAYQGYDRLFVPQLAFTTGDLDIHDIAVTRAGDVLFANTLFSCIARTSDGYSFEPVYQPSFISRLAAEDRCHLNGLALRDDRPAFATAVSTSDVGDGWRDRRRDGGVVIDIARDEVVLSGLSMPHSPRWHHDRLWLLDSGRGWLGYFDENDGRFERVAFLPGYGRGLAMIDDFAVVGLSRPRENKTFAGLELDEALAARGAEPRCGLVVIDLRRGDAVHWLRIEGVVDELYDVAALPGVERPALIGLRNEEIHRIVTIAPE